MRTNEKDQKFAALQKNPIDLGWANGWKETPPEILACRKVRDDGVKHDMSDEDVGPPHRGIEHVVRCVQCNYVYRYDSSD